MPTDTNLYLSLSNGRRTVEATMAGELHDYGQ
jgi:hypothetical protein